MACNSDFENSIFPQILEVYPHSKIESQSQDSVVLRLNLKESEDAETFVKFYSSTTHTNWIVSHTRSTEKLVFSKLWVCQHNKKNKKADSKRNVACESSLKIIIKKVNRNTIKNDSFLLLSPPLSAVVTISLKHSHSTVSAEALRMLRVSDEVKDQFFEYFSKGMTPSDAVMFHENQFNVQEDFVKLANASINPTLRQVHHIHDYWRTLNCGSLWNPLEKLKEKLPIYESLEAPQPSSPDLESRDLVEESVVMSTAVEKEALKKELERISNLNSEDMPKKEALNILRTLQGIKCMTDLSKLRLLEPFPFRRNRINVQPTSIARRRPGLVRSGKRIPAGRPAALLKRSVKCKRNLAESVRKNRANAKSHGVNH